MPLKIGIIGAGIAGLASAVRMAAKGHDIHVFEANAYPGGKLSEFKLEGFRFDAGPSLFTMPQYVEELFQIAGVSQEKPFSYMRLPIVCQYFWEDNTQLTAFADPDDFAKEIYSKLNVPEDKLRNLLADSKRKYELTGRIFLEKSLHKWSTWLDKKVVKALLKIPSLDIFTNMNAVNQRYLRHPKLVQLFNRYATYNGSDPYQAPGLLSIIPHFEYQIGAFFPDGGMYNITRSIYKLAKDLGVEFHFNTPVEEILVEEKKATALKVAGQRERFDRIISNMDIFHTYKKLLPKSTHPQRTLRQQKSTSALIFYWGIQKQFPQLDLHNIFFSQDYRKEFKALQEGTIDEDPTIYVNISQKYAPQDAPEGCENWFTMINVPFNAGQDWEHLISNARRQIIKKLNRMLQIDLASLIACESQLDPRSIESKTASHLGSLYGTSSNSRFAAFLRHANFSNRIQNLYFCGGSVHPGGGIPLCLLSAKIVDEIMHSKNERNGET